jgi:hypothetical protein
MLVNLVRPHTNTPRSSHLARWLGAAALVLAVVGYPMPSPKAEPTEKSTTGLKLLQLCQGSASDGAWCDAYITGVVEGMFGTRTFPARCFHDRPSLGDIKKVIVEFAVKSSRDGDEYPLRRPAALMIRDVLAVRYCG